MKAALRERILSLVASGYDVEGAAAEAGAKMAAVREDKQLQAGLGEAFKVGTARLRAKLTAMALDGGDVRALERLLDYREKQAAAQPELLDPDTHEASLEVLRAELLAEVNRNAAAAAHVQAGGRLLEVLSDEALLKVERACMTPEEQAEMNRLAEAARERDRRWAEQVAENRRASTPGGRTVELEGRAIEITSEPREPGPVEVLDAERPLPPSRAPATIERRAPIGRARVDDPDSPWGGEAFSREYPI
jgi:hypothetical protein